MNHYGGPKIYKSFPGASIYSPVVYAPDVAAHLVVKGLALPILFALYLGRFFSMLIVLVAIFFSIRLIPFGKWLLFVVALLPMTIASASSVGADAMTNAVSFLFIATVLRIAFSKSNVSKKIIILLIGLILMLSMVKQAHILLLGLLVLIPIFNQQFRKRKAYVWGSVVVVACLAIFLKWYQLTSSIVISDSQNVMPVLQKMYVLQHPFLYIGTLFNTYFTTNADGFIRGMFGYFGWLIVPLPILFVIVAAFTLYFSIKLRQKGEMKLSDLTFKQRNTLRLTSIAVFAGVSILISTALYIYWSNYKSTFADGIQGRYYVAILPLLLLPFIRSRAPKQNNLKLIVVGGVLLVLLVAIFTVHGQFY
jgi:uncharacterized membrane protein